MLINIAAGGTDTTVVTAANSGGRSGDKFDAVAGSGTLTFSATHAASGSALSYQVPTAIGAYGEWFAGLDSTSTFEGSIKLYFTANSTTTVACVIVRSAAGVAMGRISVGTTGRVQLNDQAGSAVIQTTGSLTLNQWNRIEYSITPGGSTTSGSAKLRVYTTSEDSTVPNEGELSATGQNFLGTPVAGVRIGIPTGSSSVAFWIGAIKVGNLQVALPDQTFGLPSGLLPPFGRVFESDTPLVVAAVNPDMPWQANQPRRPRGLYVRRGRLFTPVPAQVVVLAPAYVPQPITPRRVRGWWSRSRRPAVPLETPGLPAVTSTRRVRRGITKPRGHTLNLVPPQVPLLVPTVTAAPKRLRGWPRRGRTANLIPDQAPALPVTSTRRVRRGITRPHGRVYDVVQTQAAPTPPAYVPSGLSQPRRLRGLLGRRGKPVNVVQTQAAPIAPAYIPSGLSQPRRLRGMLARRGRALFPTPTQTAPPPPAYTPQTLQPRRVRGMLSRPRRSTVVADQPQPTPVTATRRLRGLLPRRGRPIAPVPAQVTVAPPAYVPSGLTQPRRVRGLLARRGRPVNVTPTQAAPAPPAYVPQPQARHIRTLFGGRRRPPQYVDQQALPVPSSSRVRHPKRIGVLARRGRVVQTPQTQAAPVPPTLVGKVTRIRVRVGFVRRTRWQIPLGISVQVTGAGYYDQHAGSTADLAAGSPGVATATSTADHSPTSRAEVTGQ